MTAVDGSLEAVPSPVQGSGAAASFTVTYDASAALGATLRPSALAPSAEANGPISTIVSNPAGNAAT
jgi:hypothetical protein